MAENSRYPKGNNWLCFMILISQGEFRAKGRAQAINDRLIELSEKFPQALVDRVHERLGVIYFLIPKRFKRALIKHYGSQISQYTDEPRASLLTPPTSEPKRPRPLKNSW